MLVLFTLSHKTIRHNADCNDGNEAVLVGPSVVQDLGTDLGCHSYRHNVTCPQLQAFPNTQYNIAHW